MAHTTAKLSRRKLKSGNIQLNLIFYDFEGKRHIVSTGQILKPRGKNNAMAQKIAERMLEEKLNELRQEQFKGKPTRRESLYWLIDRFAEKDTNIAQRKDYYKRLIGDDIMLEEITKSWCVDIIERINRLQVSDTTKASRQREISRILTYGTIIEVLEANPMLTIPPSMKPKPIKKTPTYLTKQDIAKLQSIGEPIYIEVLMFGCNTGLRIGDIYTLTWEEIHNNKIVKVTHKTRTPVVIPLNQYSKAVLRERKEKNTQDTFVFELPPIRTLQSYFRRWGVKAKISTKLHPHVMRATFITNLLQKGVPPTTVAKLVGHSDLRQIMTYGAVTENMLEDALERI